MVKAPKETMIDRSKYKYPLTRYTDAAGKVRHSAGNGDAVARAMIGLDHEAVVKVMKANGLTDKLGKHLSNKNVNPGQFRMMVGNALRGLVRNEKEVVVSGVTINKLDQREPAVKEPPKVERAAKIEKTAKGKGGRKASADRQATA